MMLLQKFGQQVCTWEVFSIGFSYDRKYGSSYYCTPQPQSNTPLPFLKPCLTIMSHVWYDAVAKVWPTSLHMSLVVLPLDFSSPKTLANYHKRVWEKDFWHVLPVPRDTLMSSTSFQFCSWTKHSAQWSSSLRRGWQNCSERLRRLSFGYVSTYYDDKKNACFPMCTFPHLA